MEGVGGKTCIRLFIADKIIIVVHELILIIIPILFAGLTFIYYLRWNKISLLNTPLDMGLKINGKRIFGENKTLKGPIFMSIFTAIYGYIIFGIVQYKQTVYIDQLYSIRAFLLIGASYSLGELPNSFIKRQLGISPGLTPTKGLYYFFFRLFDTFDSLIVVGLLYYLFFHFSKLSIIISILLGGIIHLLTDEFMKSLKLKK